MINVAVIGLGYIGEVHLRILRSMPGVHVVGIYDANSARMEQIAKLYGIEQTALSADELIENDRIDVYHNCTPNHLHFEINKRILQKGKHLLSEKPLALSAAEAKELKDLAKENNVLTAINFCYRYYPVVQEARERVRSGGIGKPRMIKGNFLQDWLLYETDYNWRLDRAYTGISNTMADIGSHWCDIAQFLTGSKIVSVMGDAQTLVPERKKGKTAATFSSSAADEYEIQKIEVDDYVSAFLRFDNGMVGCFTASSLCAGRKVALEVEVYGSESSLTWSHEHPSILKAGYRNKANESFIESPQLQSAQSAKYALLPSGHPMGYHDAVYNLFKHFYDGVTEKVQDGTVIEKWPNFENGYQLAKVVEAVIASTKTKTWIDIED